MTPIVYILIGIAIAVLIIWMFIQAFAYGLGGKSPLLLRPFQTFILGSSIDRIFILICFGLLILLVINIPSIFKHIHISIS